MMRFSGTVTMFGLEQVQNAMFAPTDTRTALSRLCNTLDSMSDSLAGVINGSAKSAGAA